MRSLRSTNGQLLQLASQTLRDAAVADGGRSLLVRRASLLASPYFCKRWARTSKAYCSHEAMQSVQKSIPQCLAQFTRPILGRRTLQQRQTRRYNHSYANRPSPDTGERQPKNNKPDTSGEPQGQSNQNAYGPHREYFQTPGQAPQPDLTPYVRSSPAESSPTRSAFTPPPPSYLQQHPQAQQEQLFPQTQNHSPESANPFPPNTSLPRRLLRSTILIFLFTSFGAILGTGLITWEYISPMWEEGSEEEQELVESILETIEDSSLVFGLREDGWKEVDLSTPSMVGAVGNVRSLAGDLGDGDDANGAKEGWTRRSSGGSQGHHGVHIQGRSEGIGMGRSMLYQVLTGSKGLIGLKMFHHPSEDYSIMIFFTGFGIEGWPDVVHGGMITTLLEEAIQKHIDWYHQGQIERVIDVGVNVDFKKPVQPGEIYAVLVPPAVVEPIRDQNNLGFTGGIVPTGLNRLKLVGLFMHMEGAPKVSSGVSHDGGHTMEHKIEIPGRARHGPDVHAIAEVTMKVSGGKDINGYKQQQNILNSIAEGNARFNGPGKRRISSEEIEKDE